MTTKKHHRSQTSQQKNAQTKGRLEFLLIVGSILLIPLFFVVRSQALTQPT